MPRFPKSFPRSLSGLPPAGARLCLRVRRFLSAQKTGEDLSFVAAFSGGADSSALAVILRCLGLRVVLAHLDHGLRPESGAESDHVRRFAAALGVECLCGRADVAGLARRARTGVEEAGRKARYAFLEGARERCGTSLIATGHHLDDLNEDLLLRLIRGTGWPALAGMPALDVRRRLVRPLLLVRKEELTAFLRELEIPWLDDPSNRDDAFRRNRIRNHVLPLLQAENPSFSRSVADLWHLAREDEAYWDGLLAEALTTVRPVPTGLPGDRSALLLPRPTVAGLPRAARLRLYRKVIGRLEGRGSPVAIRARTLFRLDAAWTARRGGTRFQLPGAEILLVPEGILFRNMPGSPL